MKKLMQTLCVAAATLAVAACGGNHQYDISATVGNNNHDGEMVYLIDRATDTVVDSATVADGNFTFTGSVQKPWMGNIVSAKSKNRLNVQCVVEPGNITIDIANQTLAGTKLNNSLNDFQVALNRNAAPYEEEMATWLQIYYQTSNPAERADAERRYDSIEAIVDAMALARATDLYQANAHNVLGAYAMSVMTSTAKYSFIQLDSMLSAADPMVQSYGPVAAKLKQLRAVDATSVGKHYTDIEGVDGRLSDLIDGRLALVDFYASWCGPCRAEIRDNIVPLWNKYKDSGLVVVGLNVWERGSRAEREAAHAKVMADLGITYPQLVDSTRHATETYGVSGIPQIMLIAPDGTILARDLRGAAIEAAIVEHLKTK